jgi:hypothetical protein
MLLVEPVAGRFVIDLTARGLRRLGDDDCARAVRVMDDCYRDTGDLADCVERGLELMCDAAGPADEPDPRPAKVPNVLLTSAN